MKLSIDDEQTWMYQGYQAFTEVNFITNRMMYFVVTPEGMPQYLGTDLDKKIVSEYIENRISHSNPS